MVSPCAKPQSVLAIRFSLPIAPAKLTMRSATSFGMLHRRGVMRDDAGDQDLAGRQLLGLPQLPFVLVAYVGGLDRIGAGLHAQHQVDDVGQLCIGDMRHVPAAEADMIADAILRNALQSLVQCVDPQLGPVVIFFRALLGEVVEHVGEHGVVNLQHEAGT